MGYDGTGPWPGHSVRHCARPVVDPHDAVMLALHTGLTGGRMQFSRSGFFPSTCSPSPSSTSRTTSRLPSELSCAPRNSSRTRRSKSTRSPRSSPALSGGSMKRALHRYHHPDLQRKLQGQVHEISGLLGECGANSEAETREPAHVQLGARGRARPMRALINDCFEYLCSEHIKAMTFSSVIARSWQGS